MMMMVIINCGMSWFDDNVFMTTLITKMVIDDDRNNDVSNGNMTILPMMPMTIFRSN